MVNPKSTNIFCCCLNALTGVIFLAYIKCYFSLLHINTEAIVLKMFFFVLLSVTSCLTKSTKKWLLKNDDVFDPSCTFRGTEADRSASRKKTSKRKCWQISNIKGPGFAEEGNLVWCTDRDPRSIHVGGCCLGTELVLWPLRFRRLYPVALAHRHRCELIGHGRPWRDWVNILCPEKDQVARQ